MFPAYIFETNLKLSLARSVSKLLSPSGLFLASRETINAQNPLPTSGFRLPVCFPAAAPLQDLSILQARRAQPDPTGKACLNESPDLPSLPAPRKHCVSPRNGSSFQIRYFPSGSLFLEPLGTVPMMHRDRFGVNIKNHVSNKKYLS